jgi:hypothetical protein
MQAPEHKKSKLVDEVDQMSKKMKLKFGSVPDANHFAKSMTVNRFIRKAKPTKEYCICQPCRLNAYSAK